MSVTSPVFGRWSDRSRRPTKDRHASISMYPGVHSTRDDRRSQSSTSSSSSPKAKKSDYNYRALAELVGRQPGLAVFRRFSSLNAKNLLYLQAEIADLEQQLGDCEKKDLESDDTDQSQFLWSVAELKKSNGEQWQKILELRIKLKEYNDLLLQQKALFDLPAAAPQDLSLLKEWLYRPAYGASFLDRPEDVYADRHDDDHVALSSRAETGDRFSRWFIDQMVSFFQQRILRRPRRDDLDALNANMTDYHSFDTKIRRAAEVLSIVIPSILPTATVIMLYYIPSQLVVARLAFILGFSVLFTTCMAVFTQVGRIEIWTAVVAIASVQVVFVGTNSRSE